MPDSFAAQGRSVSYGYPERYFDGDAQAFRYRIKRFETWFEGDQKMGRWEWEPWTGQNTATLFLSEVAQLQEELGG